MISSPLKRPRLTVCLLAYQHEKYIRQALEGLLHQTCQSFRIVAIDDGSTDATYSILKEYEIGVFAGRMTVLVHPGHKNCGIYSSYRRCLSLLDSEFFMAHASDDFLYPNAIEYLTRLMDEHRNVDFVYGPCVLVSASGESLGQQTGTECIGEGVKAFCTLLRRNPVREPTMLLRAKCASVILDDFSNCVYGDWLHNLFLFSGYNPLFYQTPVVAYRFHGQNVSWVSNHTIHLERYSEVLLHALASIPKQLCASLEPLVVLAGSSLRLPPPGWPNDRIAASKIKKGIEVLPWDTLCNIIGPEFFHYLPPRLAALVLSRSPRAGAPRLVLSYTRRNHSLLYRLVFLSLILRDLLRFSSLPF